MNKQIRKEIEAKKWLKRLQRFWRLGVLQEHEKPLCYKKQTKPCNCVMCKKERYKRDRNVGFEVVE